MTSLVSSDSAESVEQAPHGRVELSSAHRAALALLERGGPEYPIVLRQSDFDSGTLRITQPGRYVLSEDVAFFPNRASDAPGMPSDEQRAPGEPYAGKQYDLGFFAAITVESRDVVIDLGGHSLSQHPAHRKIQRFFALIELSASPFLVGQGPADFGDPGEPCQNIVVCNGSLLGSSHHGVHGNGAAGVLLQDLRVADYEVAAVSLNGSRDVLIRNIEASTTDQAPFSSQYSHAVFARPFVAAIAARGSMAVLRLAGVERTPVQVLEALDADIASALAGRPPDYMQLEGGLSDCNAYGIVVAGTGVHIGPAQVEKDPANVRNHVASCRIVRVLSRPIEIPGLPVEEEAEEAASEATYGSGAQSGPRGDIFDACLAAAPDGTYRGNPLSDAQILIAALGVGPEEQGRTTISDRVVAWAASGQIKLRTASGEKYELLRGLDSMSHTMKGNFGVLFLQACECSVTGTTVQEVRVAPGRVRQALA